jgi:hypothetical protein
MKIKELRKRYLNKYIVKEEKEGEYFTTIYLVKKISYDNIDYNFICDEIIFSILSLHQGNKWAYREKVRLHLDYIKRHKIKICSKKWVNTMLNMFIENINKFKNREEG